MPKKKSDSKQVTKNQITNSRGLALVEIEWIDSCCERTPGWMDAEDVKELEPLICYTAGYVLRFTDDHIIVCSTLGGDGVLGHIAIPKVAIRKVWIIKHEKE